MEEKINVSSVAYELYIHKLKKVNSNLDHLAENWWNEDSSGLCEDENYIECKLFLNNVIDEMSSDIGF